MQDAVHINQLVEYSYDAWMMKQNWHARQALNPQASTAPVLLLSYVSTVSINTVILLVREENTAGKLSWTHPGD